MFTKDAKQNEFCAAAKLTLALLVLTMLVLAASIFAPHSAEAHEAEQEAEAAAATEADANDATLNTSNFRKLEAAGANTKSTDSVATTATSDEDLDFEVYSVQKTIYTGYRTPLYIKTKSESYFYIQFTTSDGSAEANTSESFPVDDLVYATIGITEQGQKLGNADGYIFWKTFEMPGRHIMRLRHDGWTLAEFQLDVEDGDAAENAYIDSLIASQTNSSMDSFEKMSAICSYLRPKMKYTRCYTNPETKGPAGCCYLLEDIGVPWWKDFTGTSYSTPSMLCRIAKRVGGFTDIHNCYWDYKGGTEGWYSTHYLCKCTGIDKNGNEQTKYYSICPSSTTNLINAKDASELTKVDFSSTYTSRWQQFQGGFKGPVFLRLAGNTAIGTMKQIVNEGWSSSDWAIVATTNGYHDALSASGLAGLLGCPILMTSPTSLTDATAKLITSKKVKNVIVVGGTSAVSDGVVNQIKKLDGVSSVERVAGNTAIGTANKVYEYGKKVKGGWGKDAIVATGSGFQDALSIAPYAYAKKAPVFLTQGKPGTLTDSTASRLKNGGFTRTIIPGGSEAVASSVDKQVVKAKRLAGNTAYGTSRKVADFCIAEGMTAARVGIATGQSYQDALAGAALCGKNNSILVLADWWNYSNVENVIGKQKNNIKKGYILGGIDAMPWWMEQDIKAATTTD